MFPIMGKCSVCSAGRDIRKHRLQWWKRGFLRKKTMLNLLLCKQMYWHSLSKKEPFFLPESPSSRPKHKLFDRDELAEYPSDTRFAVSREEWEASPAFHQAIVERLDHQEEREQDFVTV